LSGVARQSHTDWELTEEAFAKFLARLDPDPARAGEEYEALEPVSQRTFLNKTCQREGILLLLQRLLTTMRDSIVRDLNLAPYQQFSVWTDLKGLRPSHCR
jgi:hypothetical protein